MRNSKRFAPCSHCSALSAYSLCACYITAHHQHVEGFCANLITQKKEKNALALMASCKRPVPPVLYAERRRGREVPCDFRHTSGPPEEQREAHSTD
eukprot:6191235-Pleurochrysis_carterae.AAC.3